MFFNSSVKCNRNETMDLPFAGTRMPEAGTGARHDGQTGDRRGGWRRSPVLDRRHRTSDRTSHNPSQQGYRRAGCPDTRRMVVESFARVKMCHTVKGQTQHIGAREQEMEDLNVYVRLIVTAANGNMRTTIEPP